MISSKKNHGNIRPNFNNQSIITKIILYLLPYLLLKKTLDESIND